MGGMVGRSKGPLVIVSSWREESIETVTVGDGGLPPAVHASNARRSQVQSMIRHSYECVQAIEAQEPQATLSPSGLRGRLIILRRKVNVKQWGYALARRGAAVRQHVGDTRTSVPTQFFRQESQYLGVEVRFDLR